MKITLFLNEVGLSGGIRIALHLADQLRRRGHEILIVSLPQYWPEPWTTTLKKRLRAIYRGMKDWRGTLTKISHYRPGMSGSHLDLFPPFEHHVLDSYRPIQNSDVPDADVIIATWWETALMTAALAPSKGRKFSFFQQYDANFRQPEDQVEAAWRLPAQKIVCSQWLADLAASKFGDSTAVVVNNGIDLDTFHAPPRGKQPVPTVGVMYSPGPPKAWPTTLAVLNRALTTVPNLRIQAFGSITPFAYLPVPPGTEFHLRPSQQKIQEIYISCDVWLCGSSSEGFHLPPHEAMACRTPVVSTRVGGPMDMINDGVNGYLTEPFDEETLLARVQEVLGMTDDCWRAMSDQAYATARQFTWDLAGARFEDALKQTNQAVGAS